MKKFGAFLFCLLAGMVGFSQSNLPTSQQLAWHNMEFYFFVHFGPNTFTGAEWGHGDEKEEIFNPTDLDCRQWVEVAKAAGAKQIIITANTMMVFAFGLQNIPRILFVKVNGRWQG
jgi:alpha-L-fucosidase